MANIKFTDLPEKVDNFDAQDIFAGVDASEDTSFKVTWQNFFNWVIGQAITFSQSIAFQGTVTLQTILNRYLRTNGDGVIVGIETIPFSDVSGFAGSEFQAILDIKSTLNQTVGTALSLPANTPTKLPQNGGAIIFDGQNGQDLFNETAQRLKVSSIGERYLAEISFKARTTFADTYITVWLRAFDASNSNLFDKREIDVSLLRGASVDTDVSVERPYYTGSTNLTEAGAGFEIWVRANNACTIWDIDTTIFHL